MLDQVLGDELEGCEISTIRGVVEAQHGLFGPKDPMARHSRNLAVRRGARGRQVRWGRWGIKQSGSVINANREEASLPICANIRF